MRFFTLKTLLNRPYKDKKLYITKKIRMNNKTLIICTYNKK